MKVPNNNFFHLIEKFRVLTEDDHMRKTRTTEETGESLARYSELKNSSAVATMN